MKRTTTIALFAGIFAVALGTLGLSGSSSTALMVQAAPHTQEVGMLGHVQYTVLDDNGSIKAYMQTDNIVVQEGKDCAASRIFETGTDPGKCTKTGNDFDFIAIGNATGGTIDENQTQLNGSGCSGGNPGAEGEMARRQVDPDFTTAGTGGDDNGTVVELETASPFTFDKNNATDVIDSGIFNGNYGDAASASAVCADNTHATADWDLFAIQKLNADDGITVSDGDSLSVKWTITVG